MLFLGFRHKDTKNNDSANEKGNFFREKHLCGCVDQGRAERKNRSAGDNLGSFVRKGGWGSEKEGAK